MPWSKWSRVLTVAWAVYLSVAIPVYVGAAGVSYVTNPGTGGLTSEQYGQLANASSTHTTATGNSALASADYATSSGYGSNAAGQSSTAIGGASSASSDFGTAVGHASHAGGYDTAIGESAVATGIYSTATGINSSATGAESNVYGQGANDGGFAACFVACDNATATAANQGVIGSSGYPITHFWVGAGVSGVPATFHSESFARVTGQTGAAASILTRTVGAADSSVVVSGNLLMTAFTAGTVSETVAYTDESNAGRTLTLTFSSVGGTLATVAGAAGAFEGVPLRIRCKASTAITAQTTVSVFTGTYNAEISFEFKEGS